ncbi:MAG: S41 family peptidase [Patescibacteria group bacterium]
MKKIFLLFILALNMFGVIGLSFANDGIDRDKVPYNPASDYLWKQSRTDPELIPAEIKKIKDEILNEWCLRSLISGMALESAKKELANSAASIVLEETFYKILRHGDFSMPLEEMAENLKDKAIAAMAVNGDAKVAPETLAMNAIKEMVATTDNHGKAFTPQDYKDFLSLFSDSCGIGVLLKKHENGAEIVGVQVGGAKKAGLKKSDVITEVDSIVLNGLSVYKIIPLLKGAINTKVLLKVERDGVDFSVEVIRSPIKGVEFRSYYAVGYIKVTLFTDNVAKDFENALVELLGKGTVNYFVIDLRGNPGGSVEETVKILNCLTDKGTLFCLKSGEYVDKVFVSNGKLLFRGKIVVLVDNNSASASEIIAGVLKSRGAKIIGEKTFGKGTIQRLFTFPENDIILAIKFTAGRYEIFNPQEKKYLPVDKIGIEPDIKVDPTLPIEEILNIPEVKEYLGQ